ncbi:hypothetical protein, partial [Streptomyces niveus]|uniref:hypothetical protein n=1 Tax=Streptomyces niveus TaxID=193462 RepID=UPI001C3FF46C
MGRVGHHLGHGDQRVIGGIVDQGGVHRAPPDELRRTGPPRRILLDTRADQRGETGLDPGRVDLLVHGPV